MRLVAFGTADFAVPALRAVAGSVVLVVSQPDRPSGRGLGLKPSPVKRAALELGLPVETPLKCRAPEFVERIAALDADALLVAAYGQILPRALLEAAKHGAVNLHGSVLPEYRGAAPIQRCILDGRTETGVTLMQMDVGMDTGDTIAVETVPIGPEDTAGHLFEVLAGLAGRMAATWMPRIVSGDYPRTPQDDTRATYAPKVTKEEAELRFEGDVRHEHSRYRAFTPFPGAFLILGSGHLRISQARLRPNLNPGPGLATVERGSLSVGFQGGSLELLEVQPQGKKRVSGAEFANGARLVTGSCLRP
ncbi:MAG: methionyl-tRNA formyltransferase [Armatimonadetes bacterium]|nr:methionyl-tRNA formyltransferase [Armatimonadota bacterium]